MNMQNAILRTVCGLCCLLALSGCGLASLAPNPVPQKYLLHLPFDASAVQKNGDDNLIVSLPAAAPGFNTTRMIFVNEAHVLEHYAYNQWADTPAKMLLPLLLHSLERSSQFAEVVAAPSPVAGKHRLDTEILRLQQEFSTQPSQIRLVVRVRLIKLDTRKVIGSKLFDVVAEASGNDAKSGAAAANRAVEQLLDGVTEFISDALAKG